MAANKAFRIIRFLIVPLLSLVATFLIPISSPILLLIWGIAFVAVCEGGPSTAGLVRPAFWIGLHILLVFTLQTVR